MINISTHANEELNLKKTAQNYWSIFKCKNYIRQTRCDAPILLKVFM